MNGRLVATLLALSSPAYGQTVLPLSVIPASVHDDLVTRAGELIDLIRAWPVDWNGDELGDLIVQLAATNGQEGNAIRLYHYVFIGRIQPVGPHPEGYQMQGELQFDASFSDPYGYPGMIGINSIRQTPNAIVLIFGIYAEGDARCCPSLETKLVLAPPRLNYR